MLFINSPLYISQNTQTFRWVCHLHRSSDTRFRFLRARMVCWPVARIQNAPYTGRLWRAIVKPWNWRADHNNCRDAITVLWVRHIHYNIAKISIKFYRGFAGALYKHPSVQRDNVAGWGSNEEITSMTWQRFSTFSRTLASASKLQDLVACKLDSIHSQTFSTVALSFETMKKIVTTTLKWMQANCKLIVRGQSDRLSDSDLSDSDALL